MRILLVHNFYQQAGGEDQVFADETKLLRDRGHAVRQFTLHNDAIASMGRLDLAQRTIWNRSAYDELSQAIHEHQAEVVHFHNTFPLVSPAGYRAAHDGGVCEDCMGKAVPWPGVVHRCYRASRGASAVVATMLSVHRALRTYRDEVDVYIALTEFARHKFIEGGLPGEKIIVKPNFVDPDPGIGDGAGGFALFVGRLTEEKGIPVLLKAWEALGGEIPLKVLGDGPLRERVARAAEHKQLNIQYLGRRPLDEVAALMGDSGVLVFPSTWYEGLPRTIIESYAKGTPVIASRLGSMEELVAEDRSGWLFTPGDAVELARQVRAALRDQSPQARQQMRRQARAQFERLYSAGRNYELLLSAYDRARRDHRRTSAPPPRRQPGCTGAGQREAPACSDRA